MDPVVKPFGITVKKEGQVVETSGEKYVVKPHATNEFRKWGIEPLGAQTICGMGLNYILLSRRFDYISCFLLHGNAKGFNYWVQSPCPSIASLTVLRGVDGERVSM